MTVDVSPQIGVSQFDPGLPVTDIDFKTLRSDIVDLFNLVLNGQYAADSLLFTAAISTEIADGAVTITNSLTIVQAEDPATTDDLSTITMTEGKFAMITADAGDTIMLKHGVDNIITSDGQDIELTSSKTVFIVRVGSSILTLAGAGVGLTEVPAPVNAGPLEVALFL